MPALILIHPQLVAGFFRINAGIYRLALRDEPGAASSLLLFLLLRKSIERLAGRVGSSLRLNLGLVFRC